MTELCKYIGADTDVPAGDIGTGARRSDICSDSTRESVGIMKEFLQEKDFPMVDLLLVQKLQDTWSSVSDR